jgi:hypothetical protein
MDRLKTPLALFILLQISDFATTLIAIALGGAEQNPLVHASFGLAISKLLVISIAVAGYYFGKHRGIRTANVAFSGVVVWNISVICRLAVIATA